MTTPTEVESTMDEQERADLQNHIAALFAKSARLDQMADELGIAPNAEATEVVDRIGRLWDAFGIDVAYGFEAELEAKTPRLIANAEADLDRRRADLDQREARVATLVAVAEILGPHVHQGWTLDDLSEDEFYRLAELLGTDLDGPG